MGKVFVIDVDKCNGCYNCQVACKDEHCEQPWLPVAEAQPLAGQFWMKVDQKERGQVPAVRVSYVPHLCNHCDNPPCAKAAPEAVYKREDGLVILDPAKAKGCRDVVNACPVGAIYWNESLDLPQKCTGCAHLLDDGWEVPRCVDACPTEALRFVEEDEVDLNDAMTLDKLDSFGPRVYYLNYPKRFVAGLAFDSEIDEVVIGAKVVLEEGPSSPKVTETDDFGDFRFDSILPGIYTVAIEADGYEREVRDVDVTDEDRYVGDIALTFVSNRAEQVPPAVIARRQRAEAKERWDAVIDDMKAKGVAGAATISVVCPGCGKKVNTSPDVESPRCQFCKTNLTKAVNEAIVSV